MTAAKRAASSAAGGALKKKPAAADPVASKLAAVRAALLSEGLKAEAGSTLATVVDSSLGTPKDHRHHYQESVVQMVGDALSRLDASMAERVEELRVKVDGAAADKVARKDGLAAAEAAVEPLKKQVVESSAKLSSCKVEVTQAKASLKKALAEKDGAEARCNSMERERETREGALKELALLKETPVAGAPGKKMLNSLLLVGKRVSMDPTLLETLPRVLKIANAERSTFDQATITAYEDAMTQAISQIQVSVKEARVAYEAVAAAADEAQKGVATAEQAMHESQANLKVSQEAVKAAEKAVVDAQKHVQRWLWDQKEIMDDYDETRIKLDDLRKGAINAFGELKEATEASLQATLKPQDATEAAAATEGPSDEHAACSKQPDAELAPVTA